MRYYAEDLVTGQIVHRNLPLKSAQVKYVTSGAKLLSAAFEPEIKEVMALNLEADKFWLHAEDDDEANALTLDLRFSGLLMPFRIEGERLIFEAAGFGGYPYGIPFDGMYPNSDAPGAGVDVDGYDLYRMIWSHVQSQTGGNLGVTIDQGSSPSRFGTEPAEEVEFETTDGTQVNFDAGGPYMLNWWDDVDCGNELDNLCQQGPFDWSEKSGWTSLNKTATYKHVNLHYPRMGTKKDNLLFEQGANLIGGIPIQERPGGRVSQVIVIGAGDGPAAIRAYAGGPTGGRARRVMRIKDPNLTSHKSAKAVADDAYRKAQATEGLDKIVIAAHSKYGARFGEFGCGDDIKIKARFSWKGERTIQHRVLDYTYYEDLDAIEASVFPADFFEYGSVDFLP